MKNERPGPGEYVSYFERYVSRVPETDVLAALERQPDDLRAALARVPEEREGSRYAPGKWSTREVVGHIIDTERVLGYRALCISRGEAAPLPGYDENTYAANAGHDRIVPFLLDGKEVLVAAHGNSLRALVKHLDGISDEAIPELNIPTGIPLVYELDANLKPVSSRYLGDPEAAKKAAEAVAKQAKA